LSIEPTEKMTTFFPETCHDHALQHTKRELTYDPARDLTAWRYQVAAKLTELLGVNPERVEPNIRKQYEQEHDGFREIRFVFASEPGADVPCHLLIPSQGKGPFPIVICLQGHTPGMHISLNRVQTDRDLQFVGESRSFGLQAVKEGYAALVMEQRCFGERKDGRPPEIHDIEQLCGHASSIALMLGRTMIGERVWDVSRAIDMLSAFPEIDRSRIACMGNSGGGTVTYYAACMEKRIGIAMPSCSVAEYGGSIWPYDHCLCNYIPGLLRYFEMGDLSVLIAPRPIVIVTGLKDGIFPIDAAQKTFATVKSIYTEAGVPGNCRLIVGQEGHEFYPDQAWPVFRELSKWS
jgi:dienelactone hydrolase